jgi:hypothetical protein
MANIGAAKSRKFSIGTAELRVGPLSVAGRLNQFYSVGLVDSATLAVDQTVVDLKGGFPQTIIDSAVVEQAATLTATCREFTRRNLALMLNQGLVYTANDDYNNVTTTLSTAITVPAATGTPPVRPAITSMTLPVGQGGAGGFGDPASSTWDGWVSVYDPLDPGSVQIVKIASFSGSTAPFTATLDGSFAFNTAGYTDGTVLYRAGSVVQKLLPTRIGSSTDDVPYFTAQLVTVDRATTRPKVANFWKVMNANGINLAFGPTDFASTDMQLKIMAPALEDYSQAGRPLSHVRNLLTRYPMGMLGELSDDTALV